MFPHGSSTLPVRTKKYSNYRRRSGKGTERCLNHPNTGFWEKPTGSSHHQAAKAATSAITSHANVFVPIASLPNFSNREDA
jgi:hypothetical protein